MIKRIFFPAMLGFTLLLSGGLQAQRKQTLRQFELKAESPKFWELFDQAATLQKVAGDFGFTEGPVWDEHGFLYVSDEEKNKIYRVFPDGRKEELLSIGDPDGSTFDGNHRLISTASVLRAIIAVEPDGQYRVLADKYEGKKFNSPNDVVLGPDGKRFYVDDTKQRDIHVYDAGANGDVTNGRLFGKEEGSGGVPDGMKDDVKGNLFVTGPSGLWVWDPEGHHIGTVVVPETPANLAWGDADYQTLYLTAKTSVYWRRTKTRGFVPGAASQ